MSKKQSDETTSAPPATGRSEQDPSALRAAAEAGITGGMSLMVHTQIPRTRHDGEDGARGKARTKFTVALVAVVMLAVLWFGLGQPEANAAAELDRDAPVDVQKPQPAGDSTGLRDAPVIYSHPRGLPGG